MEIPMRTLKITSNNNLDLFNIKGKKVNLEKKPVKPRLASVNKFKQQVKAGKSKRERSTNPYNRGPAAKKTKKKKKNKFIVKTLKKRNQPKSRPSSLRKQENNIQSSGSLRRTAKAVYGRKNTVKTKLEKIVENEKQRDSDIKPRRSKIGRSKIRNKTVAPRRTKGMASLLGNNLTIDHTPLADNSPSKAKKSKLIHQLINAVEANFSKTQNDLFSSTNIAPSQKKSKKKSNDSVKLKKKKESKDSDKPRRKKERAGLHQSASEPPFRGVKASSLADYKKKSKLPSNAKIFIISGGYKDIRQGLLERGWHENPNRGSSYFHFKWTVKSREVKSTKLQSHQLVNHFSKNTKITTKMGLSQTLKDLVWFANADYKLIFPNCFNLNDEDEFMEFKFEYRFSKAIAYLKRFVEWCEGESLSSVSSQGQPKLKPGLGREKRTKAEMIVICACYLECSKRIIEIDDIIDLKKAYFDPNIGDDEWDLIDSLTGKNKKSGNQLMNLFLQLKNVKIYKVIESKSFLKEMTKTLNTWESGWVGCDPQGGKEEGKEEQDGGKGQEGEKEEHGDPEVQEYPLTGHKNTKFMEIIKDKIKQFLIKLEASHPQFGFNGPDHLWIMKPGNSSRGRGISVLNDYEEMMKKRDKSRKVCWIVQKYMENNLLVRGRKFDIRQWILVTSWNPLTIWFYEDCYVRFSAGEYNSKNFKNQFIHLTNNSITKYAENDFDDKDQKFYGENMWSSDHFAEYLQEKEGYDIYNEKIKPQMKNVIKWTLSAAQDMVDDRLNSMEMYGLDLMIDENYNVWLIEVNSSPAMDYSTKITEELVQGVSRDMLKVTLDHNNGRKKVIGDTGKFTCLFRGKATVEKPTFYLNFNLEMAGKKIRKLKNI